MIKYFSCILFLPLLFSYAPAKKKLVIVWQPSHQTDTGKDFNEALVSNAIAEAAMATKPRCEEYKVWSLGRKDVHDADNGSNTIVAHTTAVVDGKISGYAWELQQSNQHHPDIFIALHNNGGTKRQAIVFSAIPPPPHNCPVRPSPGNPFTILTLTATPGGIGYPRTSGFAPACCAVECFTRNLAGL